MTLLEKMSEIYKSVDFIPKNGHNTKQSYKFMRHADVSRALRTQLVAQRIYVEVNYEFANDSYTVARTNGPAMPAANVRCTLVFHDLDSKETLTASGVGSGADTGDKHVYKAMTGALKYALKNSFLVPDEADAEADERVDGGEQNSIPDDMPDFQEAKHESAKPSVRKKAERPTPAASGATAAATSPATAPVGVPPANKPSQATLEPPVTATPSTTSEATSKSATSTTPREPGDEPETQAQAPDDGRLPNEAELDTYRKAFQKLGDELSTDGGLKSSPKLPIERKLLVFLLSITKAASPKEITNAGWQAFFARVDAGKANEQVGLKGLTTLVNRASGIEPKEKK
jgi:hypothetical protein